MKYDFICLGGGPVSDYLAIELSKSDLSFLVVSDYSSSHSKNHISYDFFLERYAHYECSQMLILSRFDLLPNSLCEGLMNVLSRSSDMKFGKLTYLSSVAVYPSASRPLSESMPNPQSEYGRSKLQVENRLIAILGDALTVLRVSNLYGALGVSKLESSIVQCLRNESPLRIPSSKVTRDFVHISDLLTFFLSQSSETPSGIFNFATGYATSLISFVNQWSFSYPLKLEESLGDPFILESLISNLKFKTETNFLFTTLDVGIPLSRKALL